MEFEVRASVELTRLHDTGPDPLVDRIEEILDELERDHGQAWLRARRFQNPPAFLVPARHQALDYVIMWRLDEGEPVIVYIGPAF